MALNRGHHLYSAGRPSRWALAHISSYNYFLDRISRTTYYVRVCDCYRPNTVHLSVGRSVTLAGRSPAKTAVPFGLRTWVGPVNHVLGWVPDHPIGLRGNWGGGRVVHFNVLGVTLYGHLCENGWTDRDAVWTTGSDAPKESWVRWGSRSPDENGQFWRKGSPIVK